MAQADKLFGGEQHSIIKQLEQGQSLLQALQQFFSELQIQVDLPGISAEEIEVQFVDGVLTIGLAEPPQQQGTALTPNHIVAASAQTKMALALAEQMARIESPVVIYGAIGVGKHLFARRIHLRSQRRKQPFHWLTCASSLPEDELDKAITQARTGTLYLDDVDELNEEHQPLVLQLQGCSAKRESPRIIAATRYSPEELAADHHPLCSLFDRLQPCYIYLPPLCEREEDIEPLVRYHLERLCDEQGIAPKDVSAEFLQLLKLYPWPGNVRELVNTLEQVILTAKAKKTLFARDLPNHIRIRTLKTSARRKMGI